MGGASGVVFPNIQARAGCAKYRTPNIEDDLKTLSLGQQTISTVSVMAYHVKREKTGSVAI